MRTTKPISTISFNSSEFLKLKLNELLNGGKISFWVFIEHHPEPDEMSDEAGKKSHIHLYMEPSKMMQTDDLKPFFAEYDPEKPAKPRGCIPWRISKFGDWYLYGLHDKSYLSYKGQRRKFHYKAEQMCPSDPDYMNFLVQTIDMMDITPYKVIEEAQSQGLSWGQFIHSGRVPIPQITQFRIVWDSFLDDGVDRNGRSGHPLSNSADDVRPQPSITYLDSVTGELVEQFQISSDDEK